MKKQFTPETMKQLTYVTWPVISGDGNRIAYVSYTGKEEDGSFPSCIHCITVKDGSDRRLIKEDGCSQKQPYFLPDGVRMTYLSNQTGEYQVFVRNLETGETRQVTTLRHGVVRYSLAGDGSGLVFEAVLWPEEIEAGSAFTEMNGEERLRWQEELDYRPYYITELMYKMDEWHGMRKGEFSHIGTAALDGSGQRLIDTGAMEAVYPAWSHNGELLAFYGYPYGGAKGRDAELFVCRADGSRQRRLTENAGLCADHCPVFTADDRSVIGMAYPDFGDGSCMLLPYLVNLGEPEEAGLLIDEWDENVCHGVNPLAAGRLEYGEKTPYFSLSPDEEYLYFISGFRGRTGLYRASISRYIGDGSGRRTSDRQEQTRGAKDGSDRRTSDRQEQTKGAKDGYTSEGAGRSEIELVCLGNTDLQEFALGGQGQLVTVMSSWTEPAELYLDGKRLTESNSWLKEYELAPVEERWVTSRDKKTRLQYFLVHPATGNGASAGQKRYPVVLDIKGGPQTMYGLAFWHEFQALAGAGIAVIYGNPRGSVGFGREFCAGGVCWKQEAMDDLLAMVDDAVSQGWIDPDRIGVTGGSYGGYMTNKLIGRTDYFAAAVTQRCLANTATSYGTGDMGFVSAGEIPKDFRMLDYLTDRARGNIISYIDHFKIPLLILHAYEDYRCGFEQAEQLFVAMKERNPEVPVRLVMFPGENHGMTRTGKLHHQIRHLEELVGWFVKYLAPETEEETAKETKETAKETEKETEKETAKETNENTKETAKDGEGNE